jgi:hypothetical protein
MEVDRNELAENYANLSDDELLDMHAAGTLTEMANEVLEGELVARGITIPKRSNASVVTQGRPQPIDTTVSSEKVNMEEESTSVREKVSLLLGIALVVIFIFLLFTVPFGEMGKPGLSPLGAYMVLSPFIALFGIYLGWTSIKKGGNRIVAWSAISLNVIVCLVGFIIIYGLATDSFTAYPKYEHVADIGGRQDLFQTIPGENTGGAGFHNNKAIEILMPDSSGEIPNERLEESITAFEKAIELDPNNEIFYANKGIALYYLYRYESAVEAFDNAITLRPESIYVYNWKGVSLFDLNNFEQAIETYDRAIELNPTESSHYVNKANTLDFLGYTLEALELYNKALELAQKEDRDVIYMNKIITLRRLERYQEIEDILILMESEEIYIN